MFLYLILKNYNLSCKLVFLIDRSHRVTKPRGYAIQHIPVPVTSQVNGRVAAGRVSSAKMEGMMEVGH